MYITDTISSVIHVVKGFCCIAILDFSIPERFRQLIKNTNRIPRTTSAFKTVVETAGSGGREVNLNNCAN